MNLNVGILNGDLIDINGDLINIQDRGYQFGDGVYEATLVHKGKCFALIPHLERLFRSLKELRIPAVYTTEELIEFHETLIKESGVEEGFIYLQITRGTAHRNHAFPDQIVPVLTMTINTVDRSAFAVKQAQGVTAITVPDIRWLRCDIKSLNLLGNVLAKQKAKEAGAYEAIQYRENGTVTEGSSSNFMVVKDGVLWSHPVNNYILNGICRRVIVERLVKDLDITFVEKTFDMDFVHSADEAFVTATTYCVMPIVKIDGKKVGDGTVGQISKKILDAFNAYLLEECSR